MKNEASLLMPPRVQRRNRRSFSECPPRQLDHRDINLVVLPQPTGEPTPLKLPRQISTGLTRNSHRIRPKSSVPLCLALWKMNPPHPQCTIPILVPPSLVLEPIPQQNLWLIIQVDHLTFILSPEHPGNPVVLQSSQQRAPGRGPFILKQRTTLDPLQLTVLNMEHPACRRVMLPLLIPLWDRSNLHIIQLLQYNPSITLRDMEQRYQQTLSRLITGYRSTPNSLS